MRTLCPLVWDPRLPHCGICPYNIPHYLRQPERISSFSEPDQPISAPAPPTLGHHTNGLGPKREATRVAKEVLVENLQNMKYNIEESQALKSHA